MPLRVVPAEYNRLQNIFDSADCRIVPEKIQSKTHISLAYPEKSMYTLTCCGMIAMKREVAALRGRFSVERMSS